MTPVKKSTWVEIQTPGEVKKTTPAPVGNPSPFKDIKIYSNNNSHSQLTEALKKYFDELKPAKKRESEFKAYEELLKDYCLQDISDGFSIVLKRAVGAHGETCHSPMAFLLKAIGRVFIEVEERRKKQREQKDSEGSEASVSRKRAESEALEEAEWEIKEQLFNKAFEGEEAKERSFGRSLSGTSI
ncbi:MAG: hypothetical protein H7235_07610 [Bdellovibrionaceae bacterium]|nr:hypothetical protein [Pseudobdellovibrionaceae bacterium]